MVARPLSRPGPSLAGTVPFRLPTVALRGPVRRWRAELADLGRLRTVGLRAAFDLAGELGDAHLGLSIASDAGPVDEPLVGGAVDLRRGLAQQSSRLPDLGPPRIEMVGD